MQRLCQFLLGKVLQLYLSVFSSLYLIYFLYSTLFSFKKSVDLFSLFSFKTVFFLAFGAFLHFIFYISEVDGLLI